MAAIRQRGATVFGYQVKRPPERFGVVEFDAENALSPLKPENPNQPRNNCCTSMTTTLFKSPNMSNVSASLNTKTH
jgi:dTDP-glucose pyrophosphorylase